MSSNATFQFRYFYTTIYGHFICDIYKIYNNCDYYKLMRRNVKKKHFDTNLIINLIIDSSELLRNSKKI